MGRAGGGRTTPQLSCTTRNTWRTASSSHCAAPACLAHTHQDKHVSWPRAFQCFAQLLKTLPPDAVLVHARVPPHEGHLPAHPASPATIKARATQHAAHRNQKSRAPVFTPSTSPTCQSLPWQAPPQRLQRRAWVTRRRRPAAGASRHGGPLRAGNSAHFKVACLLHSNPSFHFCPVVCFFLPIFMCDVLQHACDCVVTTPASLLQTKESLIEGGMANGPNVNRALTSMITPKAHNAAVE